MWRRHKTLIIGILIALTAVVLVLVVIWPVYQSTTTLMTKIEQKTKEKSDLSAQITVLSQLDQGLVASRVAILDAALPPKKDVVLYLSSVDGLARELNLSFGGISLTPGEIGSAAGSAGLQSLDTDIKIQGDKESIYTFLRTVEQVLPLMQIKDVKVDTGGDNQYSLSLRLGMLWSAPSSTNVTGRVTLFNEDDEKAFAALSGYRRFSATDNTLMNSLSTPKQDLFSPEQTTPQL